MKHKVLIWSKNQNLFTQVEDHIVISEEDIEQLALNKYKSCHDDNEGKSFWAEINQSGDMKEIVRKIFGDKAANDPDIVAFYEDVQKLAMEEYVTKHPVFDMDELENNIILALEEHFPNSEPKDNLKVAKMVCANITPITS